MLLPIEKQEISQLIISHGYGRSGPVGDEVQMAANVTEAVSSWVAVRDTEILAAAFTRAIAALDEERCFDDTGAPEDIVHNATLTGAVNILRAVLIAPTS